MRRNSKSVFLKQVGVVLGLALMAMMLAQPKLFAQSTGTVTGTVYDQSGAVVPKANVELVNDATQDTRKTTTNADGYFSFGTIQPGSYTAKISVTGFKMWQQSGIPVRPGDVRNVAGIALEVGSQAETIKVEAIADQVAPTDSGERSSVLTSKQIDNLSLEGRDATELIRTLPGFSAFNGGGVQNTTSNDFTVISPGGGAVGQSVVAGGTPYRSGTDLVSDGAHILDNGCNCGATQTVNGDMVAEVKVQTSNFGADSAKGPVVVNAVGKSGSTSYHGEVYLHARDNAMNSLDWSFHRQLVAQGPGGLIKAPPSRFLYPGGNFGGPVPHTNNKLIFWGGFEYYYQNQIPLGGLSTSGLLTDTVPTLSMRDGDFSSTGGVVNPADGNDNALLCGGNGIQGYQPVCATLGSGFSYADASGTTQTGVPISPTLFDPGAAILMKNIPLPNADPTKTGGYNYLQPENLNQNGWMFRTRLDYAISDNSKVYVTYNTQKETDSVPVHLWWQPTNSIPFPNGMSSKDNSQTVTGHFLHVFSPTLTNDFSSALGYINYPLIRNNKNSWSLSGNNYPYQGVFNTNTNMMPDIGNGYWIAGVPQMIQPDIFANGGHFIWQKYNFSLEDNVTKSYKTHTIKMGFYWEKTVNNQGAFSNLNGDYQAVQGGPFACNGPVGSDTTTPTVSCGSNNPVANLLLGVGNWDQVTKSALDNAWYPTYSGFVQDDWKATKRMTFNLGLRLDHLGAWRPNAGGVATYTGGFSNAFENQLSGVPGFAWSGVDPSIPITGRDVPVLTWQPRFGLAYDLRGNGKTVLRGGWGEYGYRDQWNDYQGPIDAAQRVVGFNSPRPFTLAYVNQVGLSSVVAPSGTGCNPCGNTTGFASDHNQPISRNYNLTISQQLPLKSLLEIGYVGSQTRYAAIEGNTNNLDARNLNVVQSGGAFAANGCSTPLSPTAVYNAAFPSSGGKNACDVNAAGVLSTAYPLYSQFANANVQVIRHIGKADYNALQASWIRQTGRITYNLNYTWSKTLGTEGTAQLNALAPDALDLSHDYGVLGTDRSHVFNFSYTFQTGNPIKGNKLLEYAVNGWNISGITTWQSGPNITALANSNLGLGGSGPQYDTCVPACGAGNYGTYAINAVDYLGTNNSQIQPTVTCSPTAHLLAHQYFNSACFGVADAGSNGRWQLPYIHGPAYFNSDLALFKTFSVTERQKVEFRVSAFNFLNHPLESFQGGNDMSISFAYQCGATAFGNGGPACTNGQGKYVLTNGGSGTYVLNGQNTRAGYASTKYGRRVMEFSAKYTF